MSDNSSRKEITGSVIFIIVCLIIGGIATYVTKRHTNNIPTKEHTYISCYTFSQSLVKDKLKSPQSAKFPMYSENFISDKGDTIIVSAYVNADNSFGTNIKTNYVATIIIQDGKPDKGTVTLLE